MKTIFVLFSLCSLLQLVRSEGLQMNQETSIKTLKQVQILVRHGDRAPMFPLENDLYSNQSMFWPRGWGQLTDLGIQQHYSLGLYFRKRYRGFLSDQFVISDFIAQSSDVGRTIQSAEANVAGIFRMFGEDETINYNSRQWQLVPIHTLPRQTDIWLYGNVTCPRYDYLLESVTQSNNPGTVEKYKDLLDLVKQVPTLGETTLSDLYHLQDVLHCEKSHNLTLPSWVTDEVLDKLNELLTDSLAEEGYTAEMRRLKSGPFISKLLENFKRKAKPIPSACTLSNAITLESDECVNPKMYFYAGHDMTITNLMMSWNIYNYKTPPYASAIILELHELQDSTWVVDVLFKNESHREPHRLHVPECEFPLCHLATLEKVSSALVPTNWEEECKWSSRKEHFFSVGDPIAMVTQKVVVFTLVALTMTAIASLILINCKASTICKRGHYYDQLV